MECPKCGNTDDFDEYRIDVTVYRWRGEQADGTLTLEESSTDETLLPLSVKCGECEHEGSLSEFGADRHTLEEDSQDDDGVHVTYRLVEAKIKIYPNEKLREDIKQQLLIPDASQLPR